MRSLEAIDSKADISVATGEIIKNLIGQWQKIDGDSTELPTFTTSEVVDLFPGLTVDNVSHLTRMDYVEPGRKFIGEVRTNKKTFDLVAVIRIGLIWQKWATGVKPANATKQANEELQQLMATTPAEIQQLPS